MKRLVVFSGFSRSGKSEYVGNILKNLGYEKVSTSDKLHEFTKSIFKALFGLEIDTYDKTSKNIFFSLAIKGVGIYEVCGKKFAEFRDVLIAVAEEALVKVFGRFVFGYTAAKLVNEAIAADKCVFFESIGGDEYTEFCKFVDPEILADALIFNVRRDTEQKGVDIRQLLDNGVDIWNNGTYEDLETKIKEYLEL